MPPTPPPADSSPRNPPAMTSALKYAVPLVLLVGVVFAVTYFSRYTPDEPTVTPDQKAAATAKPLVFFTTARRWDPRPTASIPDQAFPGFFKVGTLEQKAHFWFENRNPEPVTLQLKGISCTACSGGRVAPLPPEVTRLILQSAAGSLLPQGLTTGLGGAGMAGPAARLFAAPDALPWQAYKYAEHARDLGKVQYTVPGAANADGWSPQWGILEVNFDVKEHPSIPLTADFRSRIGAGEQYGADRFSIVYRPASVIEIDRNEVELPELSGQFPERAGEFIAFSILDTNTPPPAIRIDLPAGTSGEPGEWVSAGPPVKLSPAELERFTAGLMVQTKGDPVKVGTAYRIPVVARAEVGGRPADIGRLDRTISIAVNSEVRTLQVKSSVRGPVYLSGDRKEVAFGTFSGAKGSTAREFLTTESAATELAWVQGQTVPKALKVELKRQPDRGTYGSWELKVTVPPNEAVGELTGAVVVLETKGPTPQRIRIPVSGRATR